jgi:hypothetical protein
MTHVGGQRNGAASAAKGGTSLAASGVTPAAVKPPVATNGRSQRTTIAGLVAECRLKPRAQADQCRRKICSGYWGKADACPARKPVRVTASNSNLSR